MRRREFLAALASAVLAVPVAAQAQQRPHPVVGLLVSGSVGGYGPADVRRGLKDMGYIEGETVAIETFAADGRYERLPAMVAELIDRKVDVIVAVSLPAALAAKAATTTVPIVFTSGPDPVAIGLVANLSRPEGNLTGVTNYFGALGMKRLELLRELRPEVAEFGALINGTNPNAASNLENVQSAARDLNLRIAVINIASESGFDAAFVGAAQSGLRALIVIDDPLFTSERARLVALAARHAIPAIYHAREFVDAGGLISYGASLADALRQAGVYAGRILKGAKPAELPVAQPTKFELVVNLKTAKSLGITIPQSILVRADEVIE